MGTTPIRRWRPGVVTDFKWDDISKRRDFLKQLDLSHRVIYDSLALLESATGVSLDTTDDNVTVITSNVSAIQADYLGVLPIAADKKAAWGSSSVTGSLTGIVTGLAVVENVAASIRGSGAINEWVTVELGGVAGEIELYAWQPTTDNGAAANVTPIASVVARTVFWQALGT